MSEDADSQHEDEHDCSKHGADGFYSLCQPASPVTDIGVFMRPLPSSQPTSQGPSTHFSARNILSIAASGSLSSR